MKNPITLLKVNEKKLLQQKEEISKELEQLQEDASSSDAMPDAELETTVEDLFEKSQQITKQAMLVKYLAEIKMALQRIKKDKYGVCQNCKKPIQVERLKAFPAAKYCISCADKLEKSLREEVNG